MSRIDLNLAHVFLALWHERSVSRAAERLSLTQPAVSSALKRLRESCGDTLFIRTRHGMQPTAHAARIADSLELSVETLRSTMGRRGIFDPASSSRSFIIGSDGGLDYAVGTPLAARLALEAPDITLIFRVVPPACMGSVLERREIDLALTVGGLIRPDCLSSSVGFFKYVCISHPDFCTLPADLCLEDLANWRHVLTETALKHSTFDHMLRNLGIRRIVRNIVPSFGHLPGFLRQPDTLAIVPDYIGRFFSVTTGMKISTLPDIFGKHEIRLLFPVISAPDISINWLHDLMKDQIARQTGGQKQSEFGLCS